ncbi:MAG: type II toxin-antitoxin system death-on-curing family toxin [Clostridia bacterium]|nr:type II toxin-antitoxin system death-on-curing family toxin [Clostridia bacterium]MBR5266015.1 type II toxin-antitoxin system death-on-curing family toxin [Clostridia bacterium]
MIILTVDEIMALHTQLTKRTGGSDGLREMGLLESAVYSAETSFGGEDIYKTVEEKSARLAYSLVSNHAFVDGNKRIGLLVMLMMLKINGVEMKFTQSELIDFGLSTASGKMSYEDILNWIMMHKV